MNEKEAVVTVESILDGTKTIGLVTRDEEDGGWQFLPFSGVTGETPKVVGFGTITNVDNSILDIIDLPSGWRAWRKHTNDSWVREKRR